MINLVEMGFVVKTPKNKSVLFNLRIHEHTLANTAATDVWYKETCPRNKVFVYQNEQQMVMERCDVPAMLQRHLVYHPLPNV